MVSVLLSEGSSLSSRQTITALGQLGYRIDVCDSDLLCISRFSRFVRRFHRCPAWAAHPLEYLEFILELLEGGRYDVLLPVHDQAFLFAAAHHQLAGKAGFALANFEYFRLLQSKAAFAQLLISLELPHPPTRFIQSRSELEAKNDFPYYVKTPYSTAGRGVWHIGHAADLSEAIIELERQGHLSGETELVVQSVAEGVLSQAQAVFEHGRLIAVHCTSQQAEGMGGSQSARISVDHPVVRMHLEMLGYHLGWHGALALDYLFDVECGLPAYIEANPRLVEPMNAVVSGVNLAEILVRLSMGESFVQTPVKTGGFNVRTHSMMATLLGLVGRGGSRGQLLGEVSRAVSGRGIYYGSQEDLTPIATDWQSVVPLAYVGGQLLVNPRRAQHIADRAVSTYALTQATVEEITSAYQ